MREDSDNEEESDETRACAGCGGAFTRSQFKKKEWARGGGQSRCRTCFVYSESSEESHRVCRQCNQDLPRDVYSLIQWIKGAGESICLTCCTDVMDRFKQQDFSQDGGLIVDRDTELLWCRHRREECDECMVSYSLLNRMTTEKKRLGRDITPEEHKALCDQHFGLPSLAKEICILDHLSVCKRTGKILKCSICKSVTYCSKECQKVHWKIHKITCSATK